MPPDGARLVSLIGVTNPDTVSFVLRGLAGSKQGIYIPCSFPVQSLFRFVVKMQIYRPKCSLVGTYLVRHSRAGAKFPVFFPVSREFGQRIVRTGLNPPPLSHHVSFSALSSLQRSRRRHDDC